MAQQQTQPIEPFEYWVERPNLPSGRKLYRPLHYCLAHRFLPAAHLGNQGLADTLFNGGWSETALMDQLWRWAADRCMELKVWSRLEVLSASHFNSYLKSMAANSSRHLLSLDRHEVCLLVMPPVIAVAEARYLALCRRRNSTQERRYFTLERAQEPNSAYFAEWTAEEGHENYGAHGPISRDEFARIVAARLG